MAKGWSGPDLRRTPGRSGTRWSFFSSKPLMRGLFLYQSRPPLRTWGLTPLRTWGLMSNPTQANRQVSRGPAIRTLTALSSLLHQDDGPILWRGPCTLVGVDVGAYDLFSPAHPSLSTTLGGIKTWRASGEERLKRTGGALRRRNPEDEEIQGRRAQMKQQWRTGTERGTTSGPTNPASAILGGGDHEPSLPGEKERRPFLYLYLQPWSRRYSSAHPRRN